MTALDLDCPTCCVPAGFGCCDRRGNEWDMPVMFHKSRIDAARALNAKSSEGAGAARDIERNIRRPGLEQRMRERLKAARPPVLP